MYIRFLIVVIISFAGSITAQTATVDFVKINAAYGAHPAISMKVKYEVYKNYFTKTPLQSQDGEVKRKGSLQYSKIGLIETVDTEDYKLIADAEDKNISLLGKEKDSNDTTTTPVINGVNIDKLLKLCDKVEFKEENEAQNSYTLKFQEKEFADVTIIYNKNTFFIEKMIMYYKEMQNLEDKEDGLKESPRVEITYTKLDLNPTFQSNDFNYDKFLTKQNGQLIAKDTYKGYTVSDQLIRK